MSKYFNPDMCDGAFVTEEYTYDAMELRDHFLNRLAASDKVSIVFGADITDIFCDEQFITVVGKDCVGIMAKVCTYLAEKQINILDISQTIVSGYFNMMMVADRQLDKNHFEDTAKELEELGSSIGVVIRVQREEIFNMMHRI